MASEEKISTNILASRLSALEQHGFLTKEHASDHKQKIIYKLTEKGLDLIPMLIEIAFWTDKHALEVPAERKDFILRDAREDRQKAIDLLKKRLVEKQLVSYG